MIPSIHSFTHSFKEHDTRQAELWYNVISSEGIKEGFMKEVIFELELSKKIVFQVDKWILSPDSKYKI